MFPWTEPGNLKWVALSNFRARASSRKTYAFLLPLKALLIRDTLNSSFDPWSKKPLTAFPTSSASVLGSMSTISTSILEMTWWTDPLALTTFFKAESSHPLLSLEHSSSTKRSFLLSLVTYMPMKYSNDWIKLWWQSWPMFSWLSSLFTSLIPSLIFPSSLFILSRIFLYCLA